MKKYLIYTTFLALLVSACSTQSLAAVPTTFVAVGAPTSTTAPIVTPEKVLETESKNSVLPFGIAGGYIPTSLSQTDLNTYLDQLSAPGFTYLRFDIDRRAIEWNGTYDWAAVDRVVDTAKEHGITLLAVISYAPKEETLPSCTWYNCATTDVPAFIEFVRLAATRYPTILYWEIWNEPNIAYAGMSTDRAMDNYVSLLNGSYDAIKLVNPAATVLSGGLSPAGDNEGSTISPATFVDKLYERSAKFDAIAVHPYMYPDFPRVAADWNNWYQMMVYAREAMVAHGDSTKDIWITEFGAPTGGPGNEYKPGDKYTSGNYVKETDQWGGILLAVEFYKTNSDWMGPLFIYCLQDIASESDSTEGYFGIIRADGSHKLVYDYLVDVMAGRK